MRRPCRRRLTLARRPPGRARGQSSCGGQWPAELKWAGFDAIAITGRSPTPVFLAIKDGGAQLRDASALWGRNTFASQQAMQDLVGDERAKAVVIGPAGEKLGRNAAMVHGTGHAFGQCGFGGVAGSKNLKGIIVRGTGRLTTAVPLAEFQPRLKDIRRMLALMQSVISADKDARSRWRARPGLTWAGGDEVVPIGPVDPDDLSRQGHRHHGSDFYMDGLLRDWHVKNSGCTGCVMNCFSAQRGRGLPAGIPEHGEANCVQMQTGWFRRVRNGHVLSVSSPAQAFTAKQLTDLLGVNSYDVWMEIALLVQLRYGNEGAYFQALDAPLRAELSALPWTSIDAGGDQGLSFYMAVYEAMRTAEPGTDTLGAWLLQAAPRAAERFGMYQDLWSGAHGQYTGFEGFAVGYCAHGQRAHYGPETYGLPAGLHWAVWNRDPNRHEHNGLVSWSGLSWAQKQRVAEIHFGDRNAIENPSQPFAIGPATSSRIELAHMLVVRSMLKDSLTLCDWVFPNYCCPIPEREYAGDLALEAELYAAVTGEQVSADELDLRAEALVDLYRAITVRDWNTYDMRGAVGYQGGGRGEDHGGDYCGHDNLAAWYFESDSGQTRLDRGEFEQAKGLFYQRLGWHATSGGVTRHKLEALGQPEIADGLAALGLLDPT